MPLELYHPSRPGAGVSSEAQLLVTLLFNAFRTVTFKVVVPTSAGVEKLKAPSSEQKKKIGFWSCVPRLLYHFIWLIFWRFRLPLSLEESK